MASAIRQIQTDYAGALLREGVLLLGERHAALDALQETLTKAWRLCAGFEGKSELFPWLKKILRNSAIDALRGQPETHALVESSGEASPALEAALAAAGRGGWLPSPDEAVFTGELERIYRECDGRFATDHPLAANVIRWIAEDDLDNEEIAATLGRSPGATREFICQCRKKARVYFAPLYDAIRCAHEAEAEPRARRARQGAR